MYSSAPHILWSPRGRYNQETISETNTQLSSLMSDSLASPDSRRPTVKQIMINIIKFNGFTRINRIKIILNCCTILTTEDAERSILFFLTGRL